MSRVATRGPMGLKGTPAAKRPKPGRAARDNARGKACALRIPGTCNRDPETTVLCHLRMFGTAGMGQKPHDAVAVFACSACHDALDRRGTKSGVEDREILRALIQTLTIQFKEGIFR